MSREKKIVRTTTVSENAEAVALIICLISQLAGYYTHNILRAVCAYYGYTVEKMP